MNSGKRIFPYFIVVLLSFSAIAHGAVTALPLAIVDASIIVAATAWAVGMISRGRVEIRRSPLYFPLCLFLIVSLIAVFNSICFHAARTEFYRSIVYSLLFFMTANLIAGNRRSLHTMIRGIVIFSAVYAVVGIAMISGELFGWEIPYGDGRISFTFANPNHFAGFMGMAVWLCVGLSLEYRGAKKIVFLQCGILVGVATVLSLSRGGIIGFLGGFVFFGAMLAAGGKRKKTAILIAFLGFIVIFIAWLGMDPLLERLGTLKDPLRAGNGRFEILRDAVRMIADRPWLGVGPGSFQYVFPIYQTKLGNMYVHHAHNDYLELAADMGLAGLLAVMYGIAVLFASGAKRLKRGGIAPGALAACFSFLIHSFADFNFHIPSNAMLFAVCAAIVAGTGKPVVIRLKHRWETACAVPAVIFGVVLLGGAISPFLGEQYLKKGLGQGEKKNYPAAIAALERAALADPGNAEYWLHMGDMTIVEAARASDRDSKIAVAIEFYSRAVELIPTNSFFYSKLGHCLRSAGRLEDAGDAFGQAVCFAPSNAFGHYDLGKFHLETGAFPKACESYKRFIELKSSHMLLALNELWSFKPDYQKVKKAIPETAGMRKRFAVFLESNGDGRSAESEYALAFSLEPNPANAGLHLRAVIRSKDLEKALKTAERYYSRFPGEIAVGQGLARLYEKTGDIDSAVSTYRRLVVENPESPALCRSFASLLNRAGRKKRAVEMLRKAMKKYPKDVEMALGLSRMLQSGNPAESIRVINAVLAGGVADARLYFAKAGICRKTDARENALEALKKSVSLRPKNSRYRYELGKEYEHFGMYQEAVEQWRTCLAYEPCRKAIEGAYKKLGIAVLPDELKRDENK